jgi:hypothetical protein
MSKPTPQMIEYAADVLDDMMNRQSEPAIWDGSLQTFPGVPIDVIQKRIDKLNSRLEDMKSEDLEALSSKLNDDQVRSHLKREDK